MALAAGWKSELWLDAVDAGSGEAAPKREWAELPAIGRLTLSRPEVLRAFKAYNAAHPSARVRPFNFVSVAYAKPLTRAELPRLVAPFIGDPRHALNAEWFELRTGERIEITTADPLGDASGGVQVAKSYGQLAREHVLRPELKFDGPEGRPCLRMTTGKLRRRRVAALCREHLGKEGNLLDRRAEGAEVVDEVQQVYDLPDEFERYVVPVLVEMDSRETATAAGITQRTLRDVRAGRSSPRPRLRAALTRLAGAWAMNVLDARGFLPPIDACAAFVALPDRRDAVIE